MKKLKNGDHSWSKAEFRFVLDTFKKNYGTMVEFKDVCSKLRADIGISVGSLKSTQKAFEMAADGKPSITNPDFIGGFCFTEVVVEVYKEFIEETNMSPYHFKNMLK